jgi:hypothetical protein
MFLVYRPRNLPQPHRTTDTIRETAVRAGLPEPWLVGTDAHCPGFDARVVGFDATLVFTPQLGAIVRSWDARDPIERFAKNLRRGVLSRHLQVFDYGPAQLAMDRRRPSFPHLPCVFPGWDNSPRRGKSSVVILPATPAQFVAALERAAGVVASRPFEEQLIFVNAWNEWAEGAIMEPDRATGRSYLEVVLEFVSHR